MELFQTLTPRLSPTSSLGLNRDLLIICLNDLHFINTELLYLNLESGRQDHLELQNFQKFTSDDRQDHHLSFSTCQYD